jgi:hypothetical protein
LTLTLLAGCSGSDDDDELVEDNGSADETANSPNKTEPDNTNSDSAQSDTGDSRDSDNEKETPEFVEKEYFVREPLSVEEFGCGRMNEYDSWIGPNSGRLGFVIGVRGTQGCEELTVVDDEFDPDTGVMTAELEFSAPSGASGCGSGCTRGVEAIQGYQFKQGLPNTFEVYLSRNGEEAELVTSWELQI